MTVPVASLWPPLGLVDLEAAQVKWRRDHRRDLVLRALPVVFSYAVLGFNSFIFYGPSIHAVALTLLAVVVPVVVVGVLEWRGRVRDRREGGPAGPGPSSTGHRRTTTPGPDVWSAILGAVQAEGYGIPHHLDPHTVELSHWTRWGARSRLTVRAVPDGVEGGLVSVWARVDGWEGGKARRIANVVLRAIPAAHEVVREPHPFFAVLIDPDGESLKGS